MEEKIELLAPAEGTYSAADGTPYRVLGGQPGGYLLHVPLRHVASLLAQGCVLTDPHALDEPAPDPAPKTSKAAKADPAPEEQVAAPDASPAPASKG